MGHLNLTYAIDGNTKPVATLLTPGGLHVLVTGNYIEELIEEGEAFVATAYTAVLGAGASVDYRIAVGDTEGLHFGISYIIGADGAVYIYRNTTHDAGAVVNDFNRNQNEPDVCDMCTINVSAAGGADGDLIFSAAIPGGTKENSSPGGGRSASFGWVLEANTIYLVRLTNTSAGNAPASVQFDYHHHS